MKPTHSFAIPSLFDGASLDCRLYHPSNDVTAQKAKGAIIAHPYAPLGGCYDDPVVGSATSELVKLGYKVLTFNFRGAGESGGKTSWTGRPELCDYISVYGFMARYLQAVGGPPRKPELILSGYSYGSMMASRLPSPMDVVDLFSNPAEDSPAAKILQKVEELAIRDGRQITPGTTFGNYGDRWPTISYLLVSPILGVTSQLVTLFSGLSSVTIQGRQIATPSPEETLSQHRTLVIYGTDDIFTPLRKVQDWIKTMQVPPGSQVQSREVEHAGHFWLEHRFHMLLRTAIREWASHVE